jgi:hypothetical protein
MALPPPQFFSVHEPAPTFSIPSDAEAKKRIDKLVEYVYKNGPQFEQMVRMKQGSDPQYAFLSGGPDYPYYRWALWCQVYSLNPGLHPGAQATSLSQSQGHPMTQGYGNPSYGNPGFETASTLSTMSMQASPAGSTQVMPSTLAMPAEVSTGFTQVMDALNATKDAIQAARNWFMTCVVYSEGMMGMMVDRSLSLLHQVCNLPSSL